MSLGSCVSAAPFCAVSAFALFAFGGCERGKCAREGHVTMRDVTRMTVGRGSPRTLAYSGGAGAIAIEQCVGESGMIIGYITGVGRAAKRMTFFPRRAGVLLFRFCLNVRSSD